MKLKNQFGILLVGITVIPIIVIIIVNQFLTMSNDTSSTVPGYDEVIGLSELNVVPEEWEKVQKKIESFQSEIEYTVFDKANKAVISTIPAFIPGEIYRPKNKNEFFLSTGSQFFYQIDVIPIKNDDPLLLVSRIDRKYLSKNNRWNANFSFLLLISGVLFVFCVIVILGIIKSITKSITFLDDATKRIAQGELEIELPEKGVTEIVSLTKSLNKMRLTIQKDNIRRSKFVMGLSHDLRTPIALIKGYAEALKDGMFENVEKQRESLSVIIVKSDQLSERIDELIDYVKVNTVEWCNNLKNYNLKKILDEFAKRMVLDLTILNKIVSSSINIPSDYECPLDEKLFNRALENIVSNAIRYTKDRGHICFSAYMSLDDKPIISIKDDGRGIKEEDLPFIFDPLYRGVNTRREDGKGLGLAIVESVVSSHGWKIEVKSKENEGSEFIIYM